MANPPRICIGDEAGACDRPATKRDRCNRHHLRWLRSTPPAERPPRPRLGLTPLDRFYAFTDKNGPVAKNRPDLGHCHLWTGGTDKKGYGIFWADGTTHRAHIWNYTLKVGPVPPGKELDHFACDLEGCVNELHVRPDTHRGNSLRSDNAAAINAAKDECPAGHDYDESNTRINAAGSRECLTCKRTHQRLMRQAQRALERGYAALPPESTVCPEGHDLSGDGSHVYHGQLVCMTCTAPKGKGGSPRGVFVKGYRVSAGAA